MLEEIAAEKGIALQVDDTSVSSEVGVYDEDRHYLIFLKMFYIIY